MKIGDIGDLGACEPCPLLTPRKQDIDKSSVVSWYLGQNTTHGESKDYPLLVHWFAMIGLRSQTPVMAPN